MKSFITLFLAAALALSVGAKTKVACVGDSITAGSGIKDGHLWSYPSQLGAMLGDEFEVKNFGISARTMLSKGDHPYMKEKIYGDSLSFNPDVVIIKLGTNDSKPQNWKHKGEFEADAKALVQSYKNLESKPRIILCKPVPVFETKWGINEATIRGEMSRMLENVATVEQVELIDLHIPLRGYNGHFPDKIHPNAAGAGIMAKYLSQQIAMPREEAKVMPLPGRGQQGIFHGFEMHDYSFAPDLKIKLVLPKKAAKGKPWIWRARFWGHQPQLDIQLLEFGFHLVYCEVGDLFGAPSAVKRWDICYQKMQTLGLHKKSLLEGMSRGGLIIHNWAVANPDKVAGIICDNGVMDFKSWPAGSPAGMGKGKGDAPTWVKCKQAYGFDSDAAAVAYKLNPIDTLEALTKANIPLMYLIGDKDDVVPGAENGGLAGKKLDGYKHLKVIHKPEAGHHPHSLLNPAAMVEFGLKNYGLFQNPAKVLKPALR